MKINRTFSIDLELYERLRRKSNQSQFVCVALESKLNPERQVLLEDATKLQLMIYLKSHFETDPFLKKVLQQAINDHYGQ